MATAAPTAASRVAPQDECEDDDLYYSDSGEEEYESDDELDWDPDRERL